MENDMQYMSPMQQYGSNILHLTNPENIIQSMEMTFRNQQFNEKGEIVEVGEALMNEHGITSMTGLVRSFVNTVTIMSHLKDYHLEKLMVDLANTIVKDLMMNRLRYEIVIPIARDRILMISTTTAFMAGMRAWQGGERSFWKNAVMDITHRNVDNKTEGGITGMIKNVFS